MMTGAERRDDPATATWDMLSQLNGPVMTTLAGAAQAWTQCCLDWQRETAQFIGARLEADRRAQETVLRCRDLGDLCRIQQDWALTAARSYVDEAARMAQIAARLVATAPSGAAEGGTQAGSAAGPAQRAAAG